MCLALFALDRHPDFALVIAANRDEYHARAAAPAAWWDEGLLAGRDLAAGGTWLGITRTARWAFVTNVRQPGQHDPNAPTRGAVVAYLLGDPAPLSETVPRIIASSTTRNGFNLVAGSGLAAHWGSNRGDEPRALPMGIYGVSNARLDTPWPKVERTKDAMAAWCARGDPDIAPLFAMLSDRNGAPDDALPATGLSLERERLLSAPFIISESYGTRCTTIITVDRGGAAHFVERTFDPQAVAVGTAEYRFAVLRER